MKRIVLLLLTASLLFTSCNQKQEIQSIQGVALGTVYEVLYTGSQNPELAREIDSLLQMLEHEYSIFDSTSLVSEINRNLRDSIPETMEKVLLKAFEISSVSEGAFDITAAPLINAWGFGPGQSGQPDPATIDSLRQFVGYQRLHLHHHRLLKDDPRMQMNLNAIVKGYIVDCIAAHVSRQYPDFLVNIGGEIVCGGHRPDGGNWHIGIQLPTADSLDEGGVFYRFPLTEGQAVATSGDYRRYHTDSTGKRFSHIINPQTGYSETSDILSASVIASDCMTADALATAFMVMRKKAALRLLSEHPEWAACLVCHEEGKWKVCRTPNFPQALAE